ncbi:hypothetical protein P775_21150 [Puniceibacterium antarcticum]|uniref:Uncharacterized protein n=1 Tax=Puniceibacterium antarcticum TaxID=1206336 RepID=A0A2G8R9B1_9RHOB|nr:hypothetical protein P775_21150 [Puniceibacterium antarcticum]
MGAFEISDGYVDVVIDFNGVHYPRDVILFGAFFYIRSAISCRELEKIMAERGVNVDHDQEIGRC